MGTQKKKIQRCFHARWRSGSVRFPEKQDKKTGTMTCGGMETGLAYPKIILTRTRQPANQYEGVKIIDVADWPAGAENSV